MRILNNIVYSGGIGGKAQVAPTIAQHNSYLFTQKIFFLGNALGARPYRWQKKRFRDIIHVGLNTLSKTI